MAKMKHTRSGTLKNKEKKNLPVRLPIELHKKLKVYAAHQGKSMVEIVIEQIEKLPLDKV